jgi:N-acetyl-anhydromuramyl-L-alanine amidase AmpD
MTVVLHPDKLVRHNWGKLEGKRIGVMLHFDASVSDASSIAWLASDPRCNVSYNWIVLDDGNIIPLAPADARAWHAGCCKSNDSRLRYRDANSAFYGISLAATVSDVATSAAKTSIAALCLTLFQRHDWPLDETWRIVSHGSQAVFCKGHPKAGQYGRKNDPEGPYPDRPVMQTAEIQHLVANRLTAI